MSNWKNRLRGASNPHRVLSQIRPGFDPKVYQSVISWLPSLGGRRFRALTLAFPSNFSLLMTQSIPLDPIPFGKELLWTTARILLHSDRITSFLEAKRRLEEAWLTGNRTICDELLEQIEADFGTSLFLLELKIAALQNWRGLEAQKTFTASVRQQSRSQLVRFLAFHISERNEEATHPILFRRRVEANVGGIEAPSALKQYLRYRLIGTLPDRQEELAGILRYEANSALIDQYETLINCLSDSVQIPERCRDSVEQLAAHIPDPRLQRLKVLLGESPMTVDAQSLSVLRAEYLLDAGDPCGCLEQLDSAQRDQLDIHDAFVRALAQADLRQMPSPTGSTLTERLVHLLRSLASTGEQYEDALYELLRHTSCLHPFSFPDLFGPALFELASDSYQYSDSVRHRYFVSGGNLSPLLLSALPTDAVTSLAAALTNAGYVMKTGSSGTPPSIQKILRWELLDDDDEKTLNDTEGNLTQLPVRIRRQATRRRVHARLALSDLESALREIASAYLLDPDSLLMLPITECIVMIDDEALPEDIGDPLITAIVYDIYLRFFGDDRPFIRSDAFEDFLAQQGIERPSNLQLGRFGDALFPHVIYFLRYVCVPEVMQASPFFDTSKSLASERIRICTLLISLDKDNSAEYEQEIRDITRKMVVSEGLREVEQSKFAMDMTPLRRWAEKHLKEGFARFQALRLAGIVTTQIASAPSSEGETALPEAPNDEAAALLRDMLNDFLFECYTNSFYGLDSYLSLRARHGSLSGQLRAPLEEEHIITQRTEGSGRYRSNTYWLGRTSSEPWIVDRLDHILQDFSASFDAIIKEFADHRLQIATSDKPNGLFSFRLIDLDLIQVSADLRADSGLGVLVDGCIDVFWANVEESLAHVREYIEITLRTAVLEVTSSLIRDLEPLRLADASIDHLISAIRGAQSRLHHAIVGLTGWFNLPKSVSTKPFTIDERVDISLQQVKRLHPSFDPILRREGPASLVLLDRRVSDMLFIIFENIQKHSGIDDPVIDLRVQQEVGRLIFQVTSDYVKSEDLEPRLSVIREVIESGKYQHVVKSEGGTGLVKLWNIIKTDVPHHARGSMLAFGDVDGRFRVEVNFPYTLIKQEGTKDA